MKRMVALCAVLGLATGLSYAQSRTPGVSKRQANQQARVCQGEKAGELTPGEFNRLEKQEGKIAVDRANANGVVSGRERARLQREENIVSHYIYRQKHDAQKPE